ncbi:nSTAND1 domain-containing NTPase [Planktothrix agardhii]|uniref:nSTAND1 domain-containing NTPase n=1 Tax=Planktothrix agardhii TaxID=1160 RepID=UPI0020A73D3B|nr:PDZ domain-containing protein [Planktothrix agardhii]CAD5969741.1 putative WD repeat-containing protein slr0143 [Planktothrix agardhii]
MEKLVTLNINGEFDKGFVVQAEVRQDGGTTKNQANLAIAGASGKLPPHPELLEQYRHWQSLYNNLDIFFPNRLKKKGDFTNASKDEAFAACRKAAKLLAETLNNWLQSTDFQPIVNLLQNHLQDSTSTRILLATENHWLRRLPWCEWNLLEHIPNAEIVLASPKFKQVKSSGNSGKKEKVKILVILGDNAGTDADEAVIQELIPDAEICWLKEPQRRDLDAPLWEKKWDILFFAGHGKTENDGSIGKIKINSHDWLTIDEIKNHLKRAINNGLKLAIFNACDGLGIAYQLAEGEDLYLPQIIVMREILPIAIAPKFLRFFLEAYTHGLSLSTAIRDSRKRLQIEEKDFPCASWLPVLCQNPAEIPLHWNDLVIPPNPYQGLAAFQETDREFFFGRKSFTQELFNLVKRQKLTAVVGASGSGKSSVVLAGLIPELRKLNYKILKIRPGNDCFASLAAAIVSAITEINLTETRETAKNFNEMDIELNSSKHNLTQYLTNIAQLSSRRVVLIIDQFEELYTLSSDSQLFLDSLLDAIERAPAFNLVITLRADFLGKASNYRPFGEKLQDRIKLLLPMNDEELSEAIEFPAEKRSVKYEDGLVQKIINDIDRAPEALPLLQFALTELWKKQHQRILSYKVYNDIGSVKTALSQYADRVYLGLNEEEREQAKWIFIRLVQPGQRNKDTRCLATRNDFAKNWGVVQKLANERLVVTNLDRETQVETVEIIHEALIENWPELVTWMTDERQFRIWEVQIQGLVQQWLNCDKSNDILLRGLPLDVALDWLGKRGEQLRSDVQDFILQGQLLREQEQAERERQSLIRESDYLGNLAFSQFQAGEGGINALKIALEAGYKLKQLVKDGEPLANYPTTSPLLALQTITSNIREKNEFKSDNVTINKVIVTPDANQIVSLSQLENKIIIWNLSGQIITEWNEPDNQNFYNLAISPNGKYIVTIGENGNLYIWDFSGKQIAKLNYLGDIVKFTPDSQYIVLASRMDTKIIFFDLSGQKAKEFSINGGGTIQSLDFTANGQEIVVGNAVGIVQFWNLKTLQNSREFKANTNQVTKVAISPDGRQLLTLGVDVDSSKTNVLISRLWDLSGQKIADFSFSQTLTSEGDVSFSPDGQQIATVTPGEGAVKLYDARSGKLIDRLTISSLFGFGLSYTPDGQTIFISGIEGIKLLNIAQPFITELPTNYEEEVNGAKSPTMRKLQFSADSKKLFIFILRNEILDVWSLPQKDVKRFNIIDSFVDLSPDGKSVIFITKESIQKCDLTGNLILEVKTTVAKEEMVLQTFNWGEYIGDKTYSSSSDGSKIVTNGFNGENLGTLGRESSFPLRLWDLSTQQIKQLKHDSLPEIIGRVVVSPNGQYILTITSGMGKLWDTSGNLVNPLDVNNKSSANGKEFSMPAILLDTSKTETVIHGYGLVYGVEILDVWQNSTAIKAGLKSGDIILEIDGYKVSDLKNDDVWKAYDFLKGKAGTIVKIKVKSRNSNDIEEKIIVRETFICDITNFTLFVGNTAKFSPDSQYLATWDRTGKELHLRNINSNKLINLDNKASIMDAYFSPDNKLIVTTGADYSIKIWDFSGKLINQIKLQQSPNALTFSPDSQQIGFLGYPDELSIWSIAGKLIAKYTVPEQGQGLIQFSPDGKSIATGGRKVMIWRNQNLDELLATGCDWLKDYFVTRPEEKQKLKVCQDHPKSK